MTDGALVADGVVKRFGGLVAVDELSLTVEPGHVVACHFWERICDQSHASVATSDILRAMTAPVPSPRASVAVAG